MSRTAPEFNRSQLARAFGLRLGNAMMARGWRPTPTVLARQFNLVYRGKPISFYTARSWLRGEYLPRPARLMTLAQCLGVAPHVLMYGQFYQQIRAAESDPGWVLSDREHRLIQCLRKLSPQGQTQVEREAWRCLMHESSAHGPAQQEFA